MGMKGSSAQVPHYLRKIKNFCYQAFLYIEKIHPKIQEAMENFVFPDNL